MYIDVCVFVCVCARVLIKQSSTTKREERILYYFNLISFGFH